MAEPINIPIQIRACIGQPLASGFVGVSHTKMAMTGCIKLRDHPGDVVRIACEKCGRHGQYPKRKLIAVYGHDIPLPDLRVEIAKCERDGKMHDACGVHYLGLTGHS